MPRRQSCLQEVASALPACLLLLVCTSLGGRRKRERRSVPPGLVLRADVTDSTGLVLCMFASCLLLITRVVWRYCTRCCGQAHGKKQRTSTPNRPPSLKPATASYSSYTQLRVCAPILQFAWGQMRCHAFRCHRSVKYYKPLVLQMSSVCRWIQRPFTLVTPWVCLVVRSTHAGCHR